MRKPITLIPFQERKSFTGLFRYVLRFIWIPWVIFYSYLAIMILPDLHDRHLSCELNTAFCLLITAIVLRDHSFRMPTALGISRKTQNLAYCAAFAVFAAVFSLTDTFLDWVLSLMSNGQYISFFTMCQQSDSVSAGITLLWQQMTSPYEEIVSAPFFVPALIPIAFLWRFAFYWTFLLLGNFYGSLLYRIGWIWAILLFIVCFAKFSSFSFILTLLPLFFTPMHTWFFIPCAIGTFALLIYISHLLTHHLSIKAT
ncbi:membrane protein of unknown function [Ruminococcaceae bacterium BL-4]|nr:membrane protein of unknown function [Ruminococcaceae bacterium BL-4]